MVRCGRCWQQKAFHCHLPTPMRLRRRLHMRAVHEKLTHWWHSISMGGREA